MQSTSNAFEAEPRPQSGRRSGCDSHAALTRRALGSFIGLAVGDALGATVEFWTPREIAAVYGIHNQIVGGGWLRLRPGKVTDDTQMSLVLGEALISSRGWDLKAVADAFVSWLRSRPVDIGNTCRRGICRYIASGTLSAPPSVEDGGNGAAMRNLPTVLATLHDLDALAERSLQQAHITHHHRQSDAATVALARMTRCLLLGGDRPAAEEIANALVAEEPAFRFRPYPRRAGGYIVETVQTVFDGFFSTDNFRDCLVRVVNQGGDADTTGALAGQLAGALYGIDGIPAQWLKKLDPGVAAAIQLQVKQLLALSGFPS